MDPARARATIERQCAGVLLPGVVLPFDDDDLAGCTVADVLDDPERFEGATLADPLEGIEYGRGKAKVLLRPDGTPWINSFAHGRTVYRLQNDAANIAAITVLAGERHKAADQGLAAMHATCVALYQRDRSLVRVCMVKAKNADGEVILVPGIVPVTAAMLGRALGQSARWEKINSKGVLIRLDPPKEVVEQILGMIGEWPFPPLSGVIGCPTLRPDGSLLAAEGYDLATGLVLHLSIPIPPLSECPTRADAERALALIGGLLAEFPFANEASRAVALSMILTPVLRGAFPVAPMHLINAPLPGSGKSYLADTASAIATGDRCAVLSAAPNPEETEKRLIGAALSGFPIIPIDNCRDILQGDFLCQVTERPLLLLRRLGSSDQIRVANTFTVFANGNNVSVADDLVRRAISCVLDANMENPEKRTFSGNPLAMIQRNRGNYIAACLTIGRAYIAAGKPNPLTPLPSYERWSDLVRSALVWLGYTDPVETMESARGADPVRQDRARIFGAWRDELTVDERYLAADVADLAIARFDYDGSFVRPALRTALLDIAVEKGSGGTQIDARRLGIWLKKNENTVANGHKLTVDRTDAARPRWRLAPHGR
jgi:putative DNA primase/helicase